MKEYIPICTASRYLKIPKKNTATRWLLLQTNLLIWELSTGRKRLHRQINPIVVDGNVRDEYADLLNRKEYTPTTLKELQDKAQYH